MSLRWGNMKGRFGLDGLTLYSTLNKWEEWQFMQTFHPYKKIGVGPYLHFSLSCWIKRHALENL